MAWKRTSIRVLPKRGQIVLALTAGIAVLIVSAATAAGSPSQDCNDGTGIVAIRGCTTLIQSGKLAPVDQATALLNRAIAYAGDGDIENALKDLDAAITQSPEDPLLYYNRGNIRLDAQAFDDAIADFTSAIDEDPGFALAYLNRGIAHKLSGDVEGGVRDIKRALELAPGLDEARNELIRLQATQ